MAIDNEASSVDVGYLILQDFASSGPHIPHQSKIYLARQIKRTYESYSPCRDNILVSRQSYPNKSRAELAP